MKKWRKDFIESSNNPKDPRKNICILSVTDVFMVSNRVRYLHTVADAVRAIRKICKVKFYRKDPYFGKTISSCRSKISKNSSPETLAYLVFVLLIDDDYNSGHVILLNSKGKTIVDTCEGFLGYDSRRVLTVSEIIFPTER